MANPWHIGNTTVRTPYRLRDALIALAHSEYRGNLVGKDRESGFARLLHEKEILKAERIDHDDSQDFSDLGRKWRSALAQLGFVVQHLTRGHQKGIDPKYKDFVKEQPAFSGIPYEVTPNGINLINANTIPAQQECFLRALVAYRIPTVFETRYKFEQFSPLRHLLEILKNLENKKAEPVIKFWEMAVLQLTIPENGYENITNHIIKYREEREKSNNKKRLDHEKRLKLTNGNATKARTLLDYADLNIRYLKATGLFQSSGRGIIIFPQKHILVEKLLEDKFTVYDDNTYIKEIWTGATLPTDNRETAQTVIKSFVDNIKEFGEEIALPKLEDKTSQELSNILHDIEGQLSRIKENEFANKQIINWEEILCYMLALEKPGKKISFKDEMISIPHGEAPAYFEWILWRAFLAINSLTNKPWEARRFKIDQDFLPIAPAPGRGPDLIFEFEDYVLVVEVTLTSSSRQEAAEGEPVRRHVAEIAEQHENTGKRVYGLFIALNIDNNTAETFKSGNWYKPDDSKLPLQIIPIRLDDFSKLFEAGFKAGGLTPNKIRELITECRALSNYDAPEWKSQINNQVKRFIEQIIKGK
ncbi:MAG: AlwI family type II restriction endonuclease [Proteobacteria bacterium]|nr:AlwI family type II restriction endonuclease [Pseudomonadota bacterium]MBU4288367.1 AlwI family type II restriction endonuclease [Pseudomonadota bacterium]